MKILGQPHTVAIGDKLKEILDNNDRYGFENFYLMVAYVKQSGVLRLKTSIQRFKSTGGHVKAVVGIDQKNTSTQGLRLLMPLCDEISVYHSENPTQTFHPKMYAFEKSGEKAIVFVGSSNLTTGGLYTNYEINSYSEYDLTDAKQSKDFSEFKRIFQIYSSPSICSQRLTPELLQKLVDKGYIFNEENESTRSAISRISRFTHREKIFGTETFHAPPIEISTGVSAWDLKGALVWKKPRLFRSDVQRPTRRSAATGGVRLTQARWRVDGKFIDQATFFRRDLFEDFSWKKVRSPTGEVTEVASVLFGIKILGKDLGQHRLRLRHKPSWESGQRNYTTLLSWGEIGDTVRSLNLIDREFLLYAPPEGQKEPFYIEIK